MPDDLPVILHHFDESPFSEKVRLVFGLKKIAWTSVRISRIMPRPDLMPLTGGYRRTPVMQIGADVYCDTQCIFRELERRFPAPSLFPGGSEGLAWASAMWTDKSFFQNSVNLVFGSLADKVPQSFIEDREKLRGAKFDIAAMTAAIPQMRDQYRAHVGWIEAQLAGGGPWLGGHEASLFDINAYMNVWYVRSNLPVADELEAEFPKVRAWEARVRAIGHGTRTEMSTAEALEIGRSATPQTIEADDPHDPNGRKVGDLVDVRPDDYGRVAVRSRIVALSAQGIAIRRRDDLAGDVVVHFPRAGFQVMPAT
ncbi:glutathione S-transferase family protein [Bradyrhizobium betae]|uniref:Glutathione S-transferase family protein n=1 Tax=Bradyrhizobium betae TaxID=244734 RepID=A0A5P6P7U3_9BRAD|nr:glutathione S-transferase family protein [Bradyrhizobium betae]MCS3731383.1 glutathione S-transferase [Bradyrhizobium betae]QFI73974.1 glutathione S-transferase family protein [Bradyrhizobium betae]